MSWVLIAPWLEFYLPWSVPLEPAPLVLLQTACRAAALVGPGPAMAAVEAGLPGRRAGLAPARAAGAQFPENSSKSF